jgi:hypothetical protein
MSATPSTRPVITLRPFYGCCTAAPEQFCDCWCHDPSEGGTNIACSDADRPEVAAIIARLGDNDRAAWHGRVEWDMTNPA